MKLPKSDRTDLIEDRTDDSPAQRMLTNILIKLNPVYAVRHARHVLQDKGYIEVPGSDELLRRAHAKNEIMGNHDLIDPNVILSHDYGSLIPDRAERTSREAKPMNGLTPQEMEVILHRIKTKK